MEGTLTLRRDNLLQFQCFNDSHPNKMYSSLDSQNGLPSTYSGGVLPEFIVRCKKIVFFLQRI